MASWAQKEVDRALRALRAPGASFRNIVVDALARTIEEAARRCLLTVGHGDPPEERYVAMACNKSILAMLVDDDAEAGGG